MPKNPQAFPRPIGAIPWRDAPPEYNTDQEGMELRDYFAAKALNGMLASAPLTDRTKVDKKKWAGLAFEWADAMLDAREGTRR